MGMVGLAGIVCGCARPGGVAGDGGGVGGGVGGGGGGVGGTAELLAAVRAVQGVGPTSAGEGAAGASETRWPAYANAVLRIAGMETHFVLSNPAVRAFAEGGGDAATAYLNNDAGASGLDAELGAFVRALEEADAWRAIDETTFDEAFVPPMSGGLIVQQPVFELSAARTAGRWAAVRVRVETRAGRWVDAGRSVERGLVIGRITSMQGTLLARTAGQTIQSGVLAELRSLAEAGGAPEGFWRSAARAAGAWPLAPARLAIEGERLATLEVVGVLARGKDAGALRPEQAAAARDRVERWAAGLTSVLDPEATAESRARAWAALDRVVREEPQPGAAVPMPRPIAAAVRRHASSVALTRAVAGIEAYRQERGRLPERLSELVPTVLEHLPRDVYAEEGAGDAVYRVLSGGGGYEVEVGGLAARVGG
jgi:hypothetical protein